MKIIYLDFDDIKNPLLNAGQARATYEVGSRLVKMGHDVTVISSRYPGFKDRIEAGINYRHIGIESSNIRLNNIFYIFNLPFYIPRLCADVIIECFTAPISTLFTPVFTKIPVVGRPTSFEAERFSKIYHLPFSKIENFGSRFYRYFIPANTYQQQKMEKMNNKVTSKIIPEGVDERYLRVKRLKPEYILFLGRLDLSQKGIDLLLKSYALAKDKIKWPLIIAGNGPDEYRVKEMVSKLKLEDKVSLIGPIYGLEKEKLLSRALFVAIPSRHEGFGLFVLEALACGLPIVAFDIPGLSYVKKKVGIKVPSFDIKLYTAALLNMSKNINGNIRKECRTLAKTFSWDKVALKYNAFLTFVTQKFPSKKVHTLTIGIPAYNEEANIGRLLRSLLNQKPSGFKIEKIIVSSDGSSDNTVAAAKTVKSKIITVIDNRKRWGAAARYNQILKMAKSDALVLLDADIVITDPDFIQKLVNPIFISGADLTSCPIVPLPPRNAFEKVLDISIKIKNRTFEKYRDGNNIYTCHGPAKAFSKKMSLKIRFPHSVGCDAFSYLFCRANNLKYFYTRETQVFYRLPANISDHRKQSQRFFYSKKQYIEKFGRNFVSSAYHYPVSLMFSSVIFYLFKYPKETLTYLWHLSLIRTSMLKVKNIKNTWEISKSSKNNFKTSDLKIPAANI